MEINFAGVDCKLNRTFESIEDNLGLLMESSSVNRQMEREEVRVQVSLDPPIYAEGLRTS